jgi:hypothetical protein
MPPSLLRIQQPTPTLVVQSATPYHSANFEPTCEYLVYFLELTGTAVNADFNGREEIGIIISDGYENTSAGFTYVDLGEFAVVLNLPVRVTARPITFSFYDTDPAVRGSEPDYEPYIVQSVLLAQFTSDPAETLPECDAMPTSDIDGHIDTEQLPTPTPLVLIMGYRTNQQELPDLAHHRCDGRYDELDIQFANLFSLWRSLFGSAVTGIIAPQITGSASDVGDIVDTLQSTGNVIDLTNPDWRATYIDIRYQQDPNFASRVNQAIATFGDGRRWDQIPETEKRSSSELTNHILVWAVSGLGEQLQGTAAGYALLTRCFQVIDPPYINIEEYWESH